MSRSMYHLPVKLIKARSRKPDCRAGSLLVSLAPHLVWLEPDMDVMPQSYPQRLGFTEAGLGQRAVHLDQVPWRCSCCPSQKHPLRIPGFSLESRNAIIGQPLGLKEHWVLVYSCTRPLSAERLFQNGHQTLFNLGKSTWYVHVVANNSSGLLSVMYTWQIFFQ